MRRVFLWCLAVVLLLSCTRMISAPNQTGQAVLLAPRHQELSPEQALVRLIELVALSYTEAETLINNRAHSQVHGGSIQYWEYVLPQDFGGGKVAEVGCIYEVYCHGGESEIVGILATWAQAYGNNYGASTVAWREAYKLAIHDSSSITLMARGVLEIKIPSGSAYYYDRSAKSWSGTVRHTGS